MGDYKIIAGYLSIIVAVIACIPYFRGIFANKTKPHAFSWLVWSFLVGIIFAAQVVKHGGAGTWAAGFTVFMCFVIFLFALIKGDRKFVLFDWMSLVAAFVAMILWQITKDPTLSVILVTITDAIGFLPTLRKGCYKPREESPIFWAFTAAKWGFSIIALSAYSFVTLLSPVYLLIVNGGFAVLLLWRRSKN
jgi:hypothetical protein